MKIISINGVDGIGKTQQIELLRDSEAFHFTGRLVDYTHRWPKLEIVEEFNWWFRDVPFPELVSIVIEAIKARHAARKHDQVNIDDRGTQMFKAVCAATLIIREQVTVEQTIKRIDSLFDKEFDQYPPEQEIFLRANPEYRAKIKPILQIIEGRNNKYLPWQNEMYAEYQIWLDYFTNHYFQSTNSAKMINVDSCILDVQNKLRETISGVSGVDLPPICSTLEKLVAFGGLSESGKSSFAEGLSTHHHYYRLKIKYFNELVRIKGLPSRPNILGNEILEFLKNHKHVKRASIESLHSPDLPAYLKLLFGSRFKTIYLDTPESVRISRTALELGISLDDASQKVRAKDEVKISSGADKVKGVADIVFSNEHSVFETTFQSFVSQL